MCGICGSITSTLPRTQTTNPEHQEVTPDPTHSDTPVATESQTSTISTEDQNTTAGDPIDNAAPEQQEVTPDPTHSDAPVATESQTPTISTEDQNTTAGDPIDNAALEYLAFDTCFAGIQRLLNRGYDSVGITTLTPSGTICTSKFASDDTENADHKVQRHRLFHPGHIGIAHSRWRVIGQKTDANAHPHMDMYCRFSLVHNGIIENYESNKDFLQKQGYRFLSETDSEVIVNMISYFYTHTTPTPTVVQAIQSAMQRLEGTYALAIICSDTPHKLYCLRHGSPLLVGFSTDRSTAMIASEKYGFSRRN